MKLTDTLHEYIAPGHTIVSRCRLRIYVQTGRKVVVLTEIAENRGMSITNASDHLATEICLHYDLNPDNTIWIEHYTPDSYAGRGKDESFDLVRFGWDTSKRIATAHDPDWRRLTIEEVETMTSATWASGNLTDDTNRIAESFGLEWVQDEWEEI